MRHRFIDSKAVGSADLQYPGGFYDGRFPLPLGELRGLFPVRVNASKPLSVFVKHGDLPVSVLSTPVFSELGPLTSGLWLGHGVNISMGPGVRKYQFIQYFGRNRIILYYPLSCNVERQFARNLPDGLINPLNHNRLGDSSGAV